MIPEEDRSLRVGSVLSEVFCGEGDLITKWHVVAEVSSQDGKTMLIHRSGRFDDEAPSAWDVLGMLEASAGDARDQLREMTHPPDDD